MGSSIWWCYAAAFASVTVTDFIIVPTATVGDDTPEINAISGTITTAVTATVPRAVKTVTLTNDKITAEF